MSISTIEHIIEKYPEAKRLKHSILILPIHQKIDEKYLSRLLKVI